MAKKRKNLGSNNDADMDLFDLDELDDLLGDLSPPEGGPVRKFTFGFKRGFLDQFKFKRVMLDTIKGALPDGYARGLAALEATGTAASEIATEVRRTNARDLSAILKRTESILPHLKKRSEKLYGLVERKLGDAQQALESDIEAAKWDNMDPAKEAAERQSDEDERVIQEATAFGASVQADIARAQEASEQERFEAGRVERGIRDKVQQLQFGTLSKQLGFIGDQLAQQTSYQDQITHAYQKKSLEVQYRQLFMLRNLNKLTEAMVLTHTQGYKGLIHNTSLPDHAKALPEKKSRTESLTEFSQQFYDRIKKNIANQARGLIGGVAQGLGQSGMVTGMADMGGGRSAMAGDFAGGAAGGWVQNMAAIQLASLLRPYMEWGSDRLGSHHHRASYFLNNIPALLRDYTTDTNQSMGWRGTIQNMVRSVVPTYFMDDRLEDGSYQSIGRQAAFNQLTQRSIVEIIPGYLSRILHETRMLRTGDDSIDREVYDVTTGRFIAKRDASKALMGRVVSEVDRRNLAWSLDNAIRTFDPEGRLSDEAREALKERMVRDSARGGRFDPQRYAQGGYAAETRDETLAELREFFSNQFEFDEKGRLAKTADNFRRRDELSNTFLNLRYSVPNPRNEIKRLTEAGLSEHLRNLGLITTVAGQDHINYDKIWKLYSQESTEQAGSDYWWDGQAHGGGFVGPIQPGGRRFNQFKRRAEQHFDRMKDRVDQLQTQAKDLYNDANLTELVLKARDIKAGRYIDVNTQKVIESVDDITGDVKDQLGRVVVKGEELVNGLYDDDRTQVAIKNLASRFKDLKAKFNTQRQEAFMQAEGYLKRAQRRAGETLSDIKDKFGRVVLLARDIKAGRYIDVNTQKVITDTTDITGEVKDENDNIVLTNEEYQEGLYDVHDNKIPTSGQRGFWNRYLQVTTSPMRTVGRYLKRAAFGLGRWAWKQMTRVRDIFVKGERTPRIRVNLLKEGHYFDKESGEPIRNVDDIKGDVIDVDNNTVLTAEEIPETVDAEGKDHPIRKSRGLLRRAAGAYWGLTKRYYKWLGRQAFREGIDESKNIGKLIGGLFGRRRAKPKDIEKNIETPTDAFLYRILSVLDERLPGKEHRRGSWQDILARRRAEKEARDAKEKEGTQQSDYAGLGPYGALMGGLRGLFGGGDDEDDDMSLADVAAAKDLAKWGWGKVKKGGRKLRKMKGVKWAGRGLGLAAATYGGVNAVSDFQEGDYSGAALNAALAAGGIWASGGLGMAGSLLGSVVATLGLPVILTGAAIAGAGYLGYKYWQKRKAADGVFRKFRVGQYGISPMDFDRAGQILELEKLFEPGTTRGVGQPPTLDLNRVDLNKVFDLMGLRGRSAEDIAAFNTWMEERFKKVYFAYQQALAELAPEVKLSEIDEKLPEELGLRLLERVKFPYEGGTPYLIDASPFGANTVINLKLSVIRRLEQDVEKFYKGKEKGEKDGSLEVGSPTVGTTSSKTDQKKDLTDTQSSTEKKTKRQTLDPVGVTDLMSKHGNVLSITGQAQSFMDLTNRPMSSLETIRLKAYGLDRLTYNWVRNLFSLEIYALKNIMISDKGVATYTGSIESIVKDFTPMFGFGDSSGDDLDQFRQWLRLRFIPVLVNYAGAINRNAPNVALTFAQERIERQLNPIMKVSVAKAIIGTRVDYEGRQVSVWTIPQNPYGEVIPLKALENAAKAHLKLLEEEAEGFVLPEAKSVKTGSKGQQDGASKGTVRSVVDPVTGKVSIKVDQKGSTGSNVVPFPVRPSPAQRGGATIALGNITSGITSGSGGVWDAIPYPSSNRSYEAALPTLTAVGSMVGVSPGLLATIAGVESSFDYAAQNGKTTAAGWFQFINSTWDEMVRKHGGKYGIPDDPSRAYRLDPRVNALMGAEFIKANIQSLGQSLGRTPTDTDVYLAHFLGAGGAMKFLSADVNAIGARLFPREASKNQAVFYHPSGQARTIGEIYRFMDEKVNRHRRGESIALAQHTSEDTPSEPFKPIMGGRHVDDMTAAGESPLKEGSRPALSHKVNATVNPSNSGSQQSTRTARTFQLTPSSSRVSDRSQQQALERAEALDQQQRLRSVEGMSADRALHGVMEKQLEVQTQMRDYLKTMVGIWTGIEVEGVTVKNMDATTPNDTTRSSSNLKDKQTHALPAPVRMSRQR